MAVTWITVDDVAGALGQPAAGVADTDWLASSTAAANQLAFDWREAAGRTDDPSVVPNDSTRQGAILIALEQYRRRGAIGDTAITFTVTGVPIIPGWSNIEKLLLGPQIPGFG